MKAKLKAKILEISKDSNGNTILALQAEGKVDTRLQNAQFTHFAGRLSLKEVIANEMKIGATITISITDEEVSE